MAGEKNQKIADLSTATKDVHDKSWKMTSDYGVKQNNTDHWLTVASEDQTGPMLLEDPFGREKVDHACLSPDSEHANFCRSTASTTSVFQNAWFMHAVLVPTASSLFSSRLQMSPLPVS
jgi:hypothetical protein